MNGLFTINTANIKSAIVYGVLTSIVTFLIVTGSTILSHGSIYGVDWSAVLDKGAIAVIGVLVSLVSIIKNLLTDSSGKFLGVLQVIPKTE